VDAAKSGPESSAIPSSAGRKTAGIPSPSHRYSNGKSTHAAEAETLKEKRKSYKKFGVFDVVALPVTQPFEDCQRLPNNVSRRKKSDRQ